MVCNNYVLFKFYTSSFCGYNREIFLSKTMGCHWTMDSFNLHTILWDKSCFYLHFREEEDQMRKWSNLSNITQICGSRNWTHAVWPQNPVWLRLPEEIHLRRTFAQGHTNSNESQWSTAARWSPRFCPSPSSIWLWGHGPITSAIWAHGMNVHCWMTQLSWQCVKARAKCWGN